MADLRAITLADLAPITPPRPVTLFLVWCGLSFARAPKPTRARSLNRPKLRDNALRIRNAQPVVAVVLAACLATPLGASAERVELGHVQLEHRVEFRWPGLYAPAFGVGLRPVRLHRLSLTSSRRWLRPFSLEVVSVEPPPPTSWLKGRGTRVLSMPSTRTTWAGAVFSVPGRPLKISLDRPILARAPRSATVPFAFPFGRLMLSGRM